MDISNKALRTALRKVETFVSLMRFVFILTGIWTSQQAYLSRLLGRQRNGRGRRGLAAERDLQKGDDDVRKNVDEA